MLLLDCRKEWFRRLFIDCCLGVFRRLFGLKLLEFLEFQKHLEDICLALVLGDWHVLGEHLEIAELICVYSH
jgi:hypothetical protein